MSRSSGYPLKNHEEMGVARKHHITSIQCGVEAVWEVRTAQEHQLPGGEGPVQLQRRGSGRDMGCHKDHHVKFGVSPPHDCLLCQPFTVCMCAAELAIVRVKFTSSIIDYLYHDHTSKSTSKSTSTTYGNCTCLQTLMIYALDLKCLLQLAKSQHPGVVLRVP